MSRIDVLIADDHAIVREGLVLLLEAQADLRVAGQAEDGEAAARLAEALGPQVVLLDLRMSGLGGAAAIARVRSRCPSAKVLVLSMNDDARSARAALAAGACGYVAKRSGAGTLLGAIRAVAAGERFLDPGLVEPSPAGVQSPVLSVREREVGRMLGQGHTSREIAQSLGISKSSVDTYRARLLDKLGASTRAELVDRLSALRPLDARDGAA